MKYADMHVHTTASDGTASPSQVVAMAAGLGLSAIAITDHDTVSGIAEAVSAGESYGIQVISGIEISTDYMDRDVHMLGYFIDPDSPGLEPVLNWSVREKQLRNQKIVSALNSAGYNIDLEKITASHPATIIGRPHIAAEMMAMGYVSSMGECFEKYLGEGQPFYIPRQRLKFTDAIAFIIRSGGKAVLAHPLQYRFSRQATEDMVRLARDNGCRGIEVYYTGYTQSDRDHLLDLAQRYGLVATGGSDYHGDNKPEISIGQAMAPYNAVEQLLSRN